MVAAGDRATAPAAERAGLQRGDVLLAIDGSARSPASTTSSTSCTPAAAGTPLHYMILRGCTRSSMLDVSVDADSVEPARLYFALAARRHLLAAGRRVGAAAASRSPGDAALLLADGRVLRHAGVFVHRPARRARLDRSTGATSSAQLLLPPLFLHFALVFPDRPDAWVRSDAGRALAAALYLPALLLGGASVAGVSTAPRTGDVLTRLATLVQSGSSSISP